VDCFREISLISQNWVLLSSKAAFCDCPVCQGKLALKTEKITAETVFFTCSGGCNPLEVAGKFGLEASDVRHPIREEVAPIVYPVESQGTTVWRLVKQSIAAERLARVIEHLRFDAVSGCWMAYSGYWSVETDTRAMGRILDAIDRQGGELAGYDLSYATGIAGFLKIRLAANCFDTNRGLIPFKNGTLDIDSGSFRPPDPNDWLTWQIPINWTESEARDPALSPILVWLEESLGEDTQIPLIRAFVRAIITGRSDLQKYLEIVGPPGSGKGTFLRLLTAIVGEKNSHSTTLKTLENSRFETAALYRKRLVQITDAETYTGDCPIFKAITGDDFILNETKHRQAGEPFRFAGLVVIAGNATAATGDYSGALARRRITVRFVNLVNPEDRLNLNEIFKPYLGGFIRWALDLSEEKMEEIIRNPEVCGKVASKTALAALIDASPVAAWASEKLTLAPNFEIQVGVKEEKNVSEIGQGGNRETSIVFEGWESKLYPNYLAWSKASGQHPVALRKFSSALFALLKEQLRLPVLKLQNSGGRGVRFKGIKLKTDREPALFDQLMPPPAPPSCEESRGGVLDGGGDLEPRFLDEF